MALSSNSRKILFCLTAAIGLAFATATAAVGQSTVAKSSSATAPQPVPMPAGGTPVLPDTVTGIVGPGISLPTGASPDTTYYRWINYAGYGYMRNSSQDDFITSVSFSTDLSAAFDCNGSGWCEHETTGGDCLTYQINSGVSTPETCYGDNDQLWSVRAISDTYYWLNYWTTNNLTCGSNSFVVLGASGDNEVMIMYCSYNLTEVYNNEAWYQLSG